MILTMVQRKMVLVVEKYAHISHRSFARIYAYLFCHALAILQGKNVKNLFYISIPKRVHITDLPSLHKYT